MTRDLPFPAGLDVPVLTGAARPGLCTDCGVSRMGDGRACGRACQFIQPDYAALERAAHGRTSDPARGEEGFFGVTTSMMRARLDPPAPGAQWTGITTALAAELLRQGKVDAVLTMAPAPDDRWKPLPVIVTEPEALAQCRGMRMGYAPLLALLEPARAAGHRRLAIIGIPCQVYALRALEAELGFERLYVIGTPCSDNTTTENFHSFLRLLDDAPDSINYLEFRADFHVELRFDDGRKARMIPFLQLPISQLPADFFPMTCKTCVDYTNRLADITVGYMGGDGDQWVIAQCPRVRDAGRPWRATDHPALDGQRQTDGCSERVHGQYGACGRWVAPAPDARLAAPHRVLPATTYRAARSGIRAHAGRDEGHRNRAAPAPRPSCPAQEHGAGPRLAVGGPLWSDTGTG